MTKREFGKLKEGDVVWFFPSYFKYAMCGVKKRIGRESGVWINFFGDGQCFFAPRGRDKFYKWVSVDKEIDNGQEA